MKIKSLLVVAVLATAVLCSGGAVNAQTDNSALIAQLQAQIATLTAQLQQLIAQQGGGQAWCHTFNNYLVASSTDASTGGDVSQLQTALTKQGLDVSGDSQGTFGDNTASAVVQFQGKNGIRQTGTVGPITRTKLNSLYGCGVVPPPANQCTKDSDCPVTTMICAPGMVCPSPKCVSGQCVTTPPYPTNCTPNWQCVAGPCVNGYSFPSPKDVNNCNVSIVGQTLPSCPSTATSCTPSNQTSIKVISPNGGESYTLGSAMPITWSSSKLNVGQVAIMIYRYDDNLNQGKPVAVSAMAPILVSNTGSYSWAIPSGSDVNTTLACSSGCSTNGAMFKIVIYYPDLVSGTVDQYLTSGVADASDNYFTITGSNNSQCTSLYWIDNTTQNCSSQKQFCGSYTYQGLQTFTSQLNCQIAMLQKQLQHTCTSNSDCNSGQTCNLGVCINLQCTSLYWIDSTTQNCSQQKQFCGSYTYQGLQTFSSQLLCQMAVLQKQLNKSCNTNSDCLSGQACNNGLCGVAQCTPNWQCTAWGTCTANNQSLLSQIAILQTQLNQQVPGGTQALMAQLAQLQAQLNQLQTTPTTQTLLNQISALQTQLSQQVPGGTQALQAQLAQLQSQLNQQQAGTQNQDLLNQIATLQSQLNQQVPGGTQALQAQLAQLQSQLAQQQTTPTTQALLNQIATLQTQLSQQVPGGTQALMAQLAQLQSQLNQQQTRTCTDTNNCGVNTGEPTLSQSCATSSNGVGFNFSQNGLASISDAVKAIAQELQSLISH